MPPPPGARLSVIGEVAAGRPVARALATGEAMRIFTGGVVPEGADTVVIQEDTARDGDVVILNEAVKPGRHIRAAGIDFREGDVMLREGTRLTDRDLALAASMNHPQLAAAPPAAGGDARHRRRAGDAGPRRSAPARSCIPTATRCTRWRATKAPRRSISASPPTPSKSTTAAIRRAKQLGADILVTTGGASEGDHDMVLRSLKAEGVAMSVLEDRDAARQADDARHGSAACG